MKFVRLLHAFSDVLLRPAGAIRSHSRAGVFLYDLLASAFYCAFTFLVALVIAFPSKAFNPFVVTLLMLLVFVGVRAVVRKGLLVLTFAAILSVLLTSATYLLLANSSWQSAASFAAIATLTLPLVVQRTKFALGTAMLMIFGYAVWSSTAQKFSLAAYPEVASTVLLLFVLGIAVFYTIVVSDRKHKRQTGEMADTQLALTQELTALEEKLRLKQAEEAECPKTGQEAAQRTEVMSKEQVDAIVVTDKLATLGGMVAGVSHEMASPMSVALLMSQTILDKIEIYQAAVADGNQQAAEKSLAVIADSARIINRNIKTTSELLASFKSVSVDRASERRRKFDLTKEVKNIVHSLRAANRRNEIEVEVNIGEGQFIDGYPGKFGQILTNLLNNAYTHGHPFQLVPGYITISKDVQRSSADTVVLTIADSGIGIPDRMRPDLFKPFHTSAAEAGGSGLGLAISRHLAREMGGDLVFEGKMTRGTTFVLTLLVRAPNLTSAEH